MKVYNTGKKILLFKLIPYLKNLPKGSVIMDLGCGTGDLIRYLANRFKQHNFIGEDIDEKTLNYAKQFKQENTFYIKGIENKIPAENESINLVFAHEVIEHTNNDKLFIQEIKRILKKNGIFAVTTPNRDKVPFKNTNPDHKRHYTVRELEQLFLNSDFKILSVNYRWPKFSRTIDNFFNSWKETVFKTKTFQPCVTALPKKEKENYKTKVLLFLFDLLIDPLITIMALLDYKMNAAREKYNIMIFCQKIK